MGDHANVIGDPGIYRDIEQLKRMSTARLYWQVLRTSPKSLLSSKFNFPGAGVARTAWRSLRSGSSKTGTTPEKGRRVWWE